MTTKPKLTRADYRRLLNEQDSGTKHRHNRYHQKSRKYGDYLYHQDREKFEVDYAEHNQTGECNGTQ